MKFLQSVSIILFISFLTIGCGSSGGGGEDPPSTQSPSTKTTTVSGTVLDDNENPIVGAEVTITSNPVVVFTDGKGKFVATVEIGSHDITVKYNSAVIYTDKFTCYENTPLILSNFEGGDRGGSNTDTTAPSTPANLQVVAISSSQIDLSWNESTDNVGIIRYNIYRNGTFLRANNTTSFSDTGLNINTQYCYSISAFDPANIENESEKSSEKCATTSSISDTTPPSTPSNLQVTAMSSSQIDLSWGASNDNIGVTTYKVYRDGTYLKAVASTSTSDAGLGYNTQYCYSLSAYDAAGNESGQSNQLCALTLSETDTSPPSTPSNLQVTAMSSSQITINWGTSTDNVGITGYKIYRNGTFLRANNTTSFSDTGLNFNTQYCYSLSAYDAAGNESGQSSESCALTLSNADTSPPPTPANIQITVISSSQIDLNWMTYTETSGVIGYKIYKNGIYQTSVTDRAVSNTGLSYNTEYCYSISAYDAAGNESNQSSESCATTFGFYYDKTLLLKGKWYFTFTFIDTYTADYTLTTIPGNTNSQDGYYINGTNEYGDSVTASYWPDEGYWVLEYYWPTIEMLFIFYTDGKYVLNNSCYYQRAPGEENWGYCTPLSGYKVDL